MNTEPTHQSSIPPIPPTPETPQRHQPFELVVLIAFVVTWIFTKDYMLATLVLTGGTVVQIILMLAMRMPMTKMQKVMFGAIIIGGGLTLLTQNPQFIKWKLTIANSIFAIALLTLQFLGRSPIKAMMEGITSGQEMKIEMPPPAWSQLTYIFAGFFATVAGINTYITLFMDFNAWVMFRSILFFVSLFFLPGVLMAFLYRHKAFQQPSKNGG